MASGLRWRAASGMIGALFDDGPAAGVGDDQLIARFAARRADAEGAERAFDAIVRRHGPMVLSACRRALGDRHDAEDAFQATFLVLARRAGSLRDPGRLAPWLLGVARRTARKARARRDRLARLERRAGSDRPTAVDPAPVGSDEAEAVREAIAGLPEKYQDPLVLCDLQGLTQAEAADRLGCPIGTIGVRLVRARARLRDRLARRGIATAGLAVPLLEVPPDDLVARARRASIDFASDAPAGTGPALSIARGVLRAMMLKTSTLSLAAVSALGLAAAGLALAQSPAAPKAPPAKKAAVPDVEPKSLLANGGLERPGPDGKSPASWARGAAIPGVEYAWDRSVAHRGKASLRIKKSAQRYFPIAQWSQKFDRAGDAPSLKVAASVKADGMTKAILDVQFLDDAGTTIRHEWAAYIGAKEDGDPPATHDWTPYAGTVAIPAGTKAIVVAAQVYGPGTVRFDDLTADYSNDPPPVEKREQARADLDDLDGVVTYAAEAGGDPRKTYFVSRGPYPDNTPPTGDGAPPEGHRLLVVLPGGDGGPGFLPFVRRIARHATPPGTLVVQLKAVAWTRDQAERVVWPTSRDDLPGVGFTTEAFVDAVVADIRAKRRIDPRHVVALGWSSSGPAVYAAMLRPSTPLTGAVVAMSVFKPDRLPPLPSALGRSFYLLHSPDDPLIPLSMPESARDALRRAGATVELQTYDGGHGWHGDVFGQTRGGLDWLDARGG